MLRLVIGMQLKRIKASAGYTLVEILVVILIIAIITTIAVLMFSHFNRGRHVTITANRLLQTIHVAEEEAILRPAVLGLRFSSKGYQFYQLVSDKKMQKLHWKALKNDRLSRPNAFLQGIIAKRSQVDHLAKKEKPTIVFSPSGNVSPFRLMLTNRAHDRVYRIAVTENGVARLKEVSK